MQGERRPDRKSFYLTKVHTGFVVPGNPFFEQERSLNVEDCGWREYLNFPARIGMSDSVEVEERKYAVEDARHQWLHIALCQKKSKLHRIYLRDYKFTVSVLLGWIKC